MLTSLVAICGAIDEYRLSFVPGYDAGTQVAHADVQRGFVADTALLSARQSRRLTNLM